MQSPTESLPQFTKDGLLPAGKYRLASWNEFESRFGQTQRRHCLIFGGQIDMVLDEGTQTEPCVIIGMRMALLNLKEAGCKTVYINGSFVTDKLNPNDYDGYWDSQGVDSKKLDKALLKVDLPGCKEQKRKYGGELLIKGMSANDGRLIDDYFRFNTPRAIEKGIVVIDLQTITF